MQRTMCKSSLGGPFSPRFLITIRDSRRDDTLLEQRLLAMEQKLLSLEQSKRYEQPSPVSGRSIEVRTSTSPQTHGGRQSESNTVGFTATPDQDDVVDGMGAVALKDGAAEEEYFGKDCPGPLQALFRTLADNVPWLRREGPSSNVALLRSIVRGVGQPVNQAAGRPRQTMDGPVDPTGESSSAFLRRPANSDQSREGGQRRIVEPFALPTQREAEELLQVYFSTVNLMLPCIHEASFRTIYKTARSDGLRAVRRSWLGVFNMMLALATNVITATSPPLERATWADTYFERAVELAKPDILGRLSLELGLFDPHLPAIVALPFLTFANSSSVILPHVDLPSRYSILFPGLDFP